MSDQPQPQPVRTGDVYPPSAAAHDARRQRDEVLTHDGQQEKQNDGRRGKLRVTEADEPHAGRRIVAATAGGQVTTARLHISGSMNLHGDVMSVRA